jgi:cytochrome c biogenesis protein CcmG/thiol:disulfide interchange protein DsbE
MPRIVRGAGSALLPFVMFVCLALTAGCSREQSWQVGTPAPSISVLDRDDATVKLSDFRGKAVVVRFWASGCRACIEGMPALDRYRRAYDDRDLAVIAVNMGNSKEMVDAFAKNLKISYPVLRDPALIASKKYNVTSVPTTFFIDRKGIARKRVQGELTGEDFNQTVRELL